jgi:putative transposase
MAFYNRSRPAHFPPIPRRENPVVVFVTVCTQSRSVNLCNDIIHNTLIEVWHKFNYWLVGDYVLMPDHLHFLCAPLAGYPSTLHDWMKAWKATSVRMLKEKELWQRNYWDTQIRSADHLIERQGYMEKNPVSAKLCGSINDWRYRGRVFEIYTGKDFCT